MVRITSLLAMLGALAPLPHIALADDVQSDAGQGGHATVQYAVTGPNQASVMVEPVRWNGGYRYGWGGPRYYGGYYGAYRPYNV
jgi:hypothetical protein